MKYQITKRDPAYDTDPNWVALMTNGDRVASASTLDRCEACGGEAHYHMLAYRVCVECNSCETRTVFCENASEAMVAWNKQQRGIITEELI